MAATGGATVASIATTLDGGTAETETTAPTGPDVPNGDPGGVGPPLTPRPTCVPDATGVAAQSVEHLDLGDLDSGLALSAVGWFDADEHRDLALASNDGRVMVLRSDESGVPAMISERGASVQLDGAPSGLIGADLDADGRQELIFGSSVVTTDPDGGLGPVAQLPAVVDHVADADGDGILDLVSVSGLSLDVWVGLGDGEFAPEPLQHPLDFEPDAHELADVDADGLDELIMVDNRSGQFGAEPAVFQVMWAEENGTYVPGEEVFLDASNYALATTDIDCDGTLELALAERSGAEIELWAWADEWTQTGTIAAIEPRAVVSADFNGDGVFDVAYQDRSDSQQELAIRVASGVGDGTFHPPIELLSSPLNELVGLADPDSDERFSVVVAPGTSVWVYDVE